MAEFVRPSGLTVQRSFLFVAEQILLAPEVGVHSDLRDVNGVSQLWWQSDRRIYASSLKITGARLLRAQPVGSKVIEAMFTVSDGDGDETSLHVQRKDDANYYEDDHARDVLDLFSPLYKHSHERCVGILKAASARVEVTPFDYADIVSSE